MKKVVLTPLYGQNPNAENAAIAFSERQWGKVLKLRKSFPECWDPEYAAGVQIGNVISSPTYRGGSFPLHRGQCPLHRLNFGSLQP